MKVHVFISILFKFSVFNSPSTTVTHKRVCAYTKRRQTMGKVTEWFFYYFLIFKLVRVAKLKFPTFQQSKSIANCSGKP